VTQRPPESQYATIALANQKGGVGKTTNAVNLAGELARRGQQVLLIDCDPQGNATTSLGIAKRDLRATTYEVIAGLAGLDVAIQPTGRAGFDLVPANEHLAGAMVELTTVERREWRLADALRQVAGYDWVILDCPPSLGLLTLNALCATQSVLIPLQCEYLALEGLVQLKGTIDRVREHLNPGLAIVGVVMTMYDGRTNLAQQVVEEVRRFFPDRIFNTLIPRSVRVSEAPSYGQTIAEYDPHSRAAQAYAMLADEVLRRIGKRVHTP
jgi:chromosome partitioning protein